MTDSTPNAWAEVLAYIREGSAFHDRSIDVAADQFRGGYVVFHDHAAVAIVDRGGTITPNGAIGREVDPGLDEVYRRVEPALREYAQLMAKKGDEEEE